MEEVDNKKWVHRGILGRSGGVFGHLGRSRGCLGGVLRQFFRALASLGIVLERSWERGRTGQRGEWAEARRLRPRGPEGSRKCPRPGTETLISMLELPSNGSKVTR